MVLVGIGQTTPLLRQGEVVRINENPLSWIVLSLGLLLAASHGTWAATKVEAPVKMLKTGQNRVAVLTALEKGAENRVRFQTLEPIYGESDDQVTIRLDESTYRDVSEGETYVVAFSNLRRNRRFRDLVEVDPEGFRVLGVLGGGPALFQDRPAVRRLFASEQGKSAPPPKARLEAALVTMQSRDSRTQALGVLEFHFRPEWYPLMGTEDVAILRGMLRESTLPLDRRELLLDSASQLPSSLSTSWLTEEARQVLRKLEPQFDLTSFAPRLAITAIGILRDGGDEGDGSEVARFLGANNPGVVRATLEALDSIDPSLARARVAVVLERSDLHSESRRALSEYLQSKPPASGSTR